MSLASRWKPRDLLIAAVLAALAVAAAWASWTEIWTIATRDQENTHILLAIPVALWLGWLRRSRLRHVRPRPHLAGVGLVLVGMAGELWGFYAEVDVARHAGAILMAIGAIVSVLGLKLLIEFKPSVMALAFLMPIPGRIRSEIAGPLQNYSAQFTEFLLGLFGAPISRAENFLVINEQQVAIAEACNGMRMVSALALVAFFFVFSIPMRNGLRIAILLLSPIVALLVNIIRLVPTTLMYGYTEPDTAKLFHDLSGWAVLGVALAILWGFVSLLRWLEVPIDPYPVAKGAAT